MTKLYYICSYKSTKEGGGKSPEEKIYNKRDEETPGLGAEPISNLEILESKINFLCALGFVTPRTRFMAVSSDQHLSDPAEDALIDQKEGHRGVYPQG